MSESMATAGLGDAPAVEHPGRLGRVAILRPLVLRDFPRVMSLVMLGSFGLGPLSLALAGLVIDSAATALYVAAGTLVLVTALAGIVTGVHRRLDVPAPDARATT